MTTIEGNSVDDGPPTIYEAAVAEGLALVKQCAEDREGIGALLKQRREARMRLGALADQITSVYGEATLARYAAAVGVNESSLNSYRAVFRAWERKNYPGNNFGAAQALAPVPEREEILAKEPAMSKRRAQSIAKK